MRIRSGITLLMTAVLCAAPGTAGAEQPAPAPTTAAPESSIALGYFPNWSRYHGDHLVRDVHTSGAADALTHLGYAFGAVTSEGECALDSPWEDYQERYSAADSITGTADSYTQPLAGNLHQLRELKQRHPHLRVLITLGGDTGAADWSAAAATEESRARFVASCLDLFIEGNLPIADGEPQGGPGVAEGIFDGVDLDWEWPVTPIDGGGPFPADRTNHLLLVEEFRTALDEYGDAHGRRLSLNITMPADPALIDTGYDLDGLFEHVDFTTVQGYNLYGAWNEANLRTNFHSQLHSPAANPAYTPASGDIAVRHLLDNGVPAERIVLGIPAFGRGWAGVDAADDGVYQLGTGPAPSSVDENGGWDLYSVIRDKDALHLVDEEAVSAYAYDGDQWWSYDNPETVARKAAYARDLGLGGGMLWSLNGDPDAELVTALAENLD